MLYGHRVNNTGGRIHTPQLGYLPLSSPSLSLPFPFPSLLEVGPLKTTRVWGALSPPAGSGAETQRKSNWVHFSLKICHLVVPILLILWPDCLTGWGPWPDWGGMAGLAPWIRQLLTAVINSYYCYLDRRVGRHEAASSDIYL